MRAGARQPERHSSTTTSLTATPPPPTSHPSTRNASHLCRTRTWSTTTERRTPSHRVPPCPPRPGARQPSLRRGWPWRASTTSTSSPPSSSPPGWVRPPPLSRYRPSMPLMHARVPCRCQGTHADPPLRTHDIHPSASVSELAAGVLAEILRRVPHATLALLEGRQGARTNARLRAEARLLGVDPHRLLTARPQSKDLHLLRSRDFHLFLDTWKVSPPVIIFREQCAEKQCAETRVQRRAH